MKFNEQIKINKIPNNEEFDLEDNKLEKTQIKKGVDFVFEQNPELEKIGTKEQYSEYLDTIFSESKVKDIVYHGSRNEFEYFDKSKLGSYTNSPSAKLGIFFASSLDNAKHYTFEGFVKFLEGTEDVSKFKIFREAVIYYKQEAIKDYNNLYNDLRNNKNLSFSLEVDIRKQKLIGRIIETIKKSLNVGYVNKAKKLDELKTIIESQETNLKNINDKIKEFSELSFKSDYEIKSVIEDEELLSRYGKTIVKSVIINSKNPSFYSDNNNSYRHESYVSRIIDSINNEKDGVIIKDTKDPLSTDVYVVFEPKQIHILGSKSDIEKFKEFISNKNEIQKIEDISFEEVSPDTSDSVEVKVQRDDSEEIILKKLKDKLIQENWWLQDEFKNEGFPKEQFIINGNHNKYSIYNFNENLSEEQKSSIIKGISFLENSIEIPSLKGITVLIRKTERINSNSQQPFYGNNYSESKVINIYPRALKNESYREIPEISGLEATIVHEFSHPIYDKMEQKLKEKWSNFGWETTTEEERKNENMYAVKPKESNKCITKYAQFAPDEDFCESIVGLCAQSLKLDQEKKIFLESNIFNEIKNVTLAQITKKEKIELPKLPENIKFHKKEVSKISIIKK